MWRVCDLAVDRLPLSVAVCIRLAAGDFDPLIVAMQGGDRHARQTRPGGDELPFAESVKLTVADGQMHVYGRLRPYTMGDVPLIVSDFGTLLGDLALRFGLRPRFVWLNFSHVTR